MHRGTGNLQYVYTLGNQKFVLTGVEKDLDVYLMTASLITTKMLWVANVGTYQEIFCQLWSGFGKKPKCHEWKIKSMFSKHVLPKYASKHGANIDNACKCL